MKRKTKIKLIILILVIILIVFTGFIIYKNIYNLKEFNEYIGIESTTNLKGFKSINSNSQIIYSKKAKMNKYIGEVKLIRSEIDNSYISNEFETILCSSTEKNLEDIASKFVDISKEYVNCKEAVISMMIEAKQDEKIDDNNSLEVLLNNNLKISYNFENEAKSYIIRIYKENNNIIGIFSYNGEMPKAKRPEELTEEEKINSTEKLNLNYNAFENGVG